jgi:hypothetical protein
MANRSAAIAHIDAKAAASGAADSISRSSCQAAAAVANSCNCSGVATAATVSA